MKSAKPTSLTQWMHVVSSEARQTLGASKASDHLMQQPAIQNGRKSYIKAPVDPDSRRRTSPPHKMD